MKKKCQIVKMMIYKPLWNKKEDEIRGNRWKGIFWLVTTGLRQGLMEVT
jgi:hypothetical protein